MHEVELKSVVDDLPLRRRHVEGAGGRLRFAGTMMDRDYTLDTRPDSGAGWPRVRTYQAPAGGWTELTWKGSARSHRARLPGHGDSPRAVHRRAAEGIPPPLRGADRHEGLADVMRA
ncbi:hypothetical protein HI292_00935 [Corallococcus exiguus]|nr:hypothetical protein [Corallococcus exiguus]